jgi:hypothetical protein
MARILAIDGSPLNGGPVSSVVESAAAAAESAGATVVRIRLYDHYIRCRTRYEELMSGELHRFSDDLDTVADEIVASDGVIVGTAVSYVQADPATRDLLRRLERRFARGVERETDGGPRRLKAGRRLALVTTCPSPVAVAALCAHSVGSVGALKRSFAKAGVRALGSVTVTDKYTQPLGRDLALGRAARLGLKLAEQELHHAAARVHGEAGRRSGSLVEALGAAGIDTRTPEHEGNRLAHVGL